MIYKYRIITCHDSYYIIMYLISPDVGGQLGSYFTYVKSTPRHSNSVDLSSWSLYNNKPGKIETIQVHNTQICLGTDNYSVQIQTQI